MTSRPFLFFLPLLFLWSSTALAQVTVKEWKLYRLDTGELLDSDTELNRFFNKGNCECEIPMRLEITLNGDYINADYEFAIVAGDTCLDATNETIKTTCKELFSERFKSWGKGQWPITDINGAKLTAKTLMQDACDTAEREPFEIAMYTDDNSDERWVKDGTAIAYTVDTDPPIQVKNPSLKAGEGQVTISFDAPYSTTTSGDGGTASGETNVKYQVLCEKTDGSPVFSSPAEAGYDVCVGGASTTPDAGTSGDGSSGTSFGPKPRAGDAGGDAGGDATAAAGDAGLDAKPADGTPKLEAGAPDATPGLEASTPGREAGAADAGPRDSGGTSSGSGATSLDPRYVCSSAQSGASSITVDKLENDESYRFYIVTIDAARNPSEPLLVGEAEPQLAEDLWERYRRLGGPAEGGYCFVATAVHGSYSHPHVRVLREFRDQVLLRSDEGRLFVQLYYATGPVAASWIAGDARARAAARALLWPVTVAAAAHLYTPPWHKALVLVSLVMGVGLLVRRRRRSR
jgi:hypothetical protein